MSTSKIRQGTDKIVESVSQGAHEKIDSIDQKARAGIEAGRRKAHDALSAADDIEAKVEQTIEATAEKVTRYVQENPLQAAGIAFAAGVLTTLVLRKR